MFCDFMSARAVRDSDFTQISLISGRHRNATALTVPASSVVLCALSFLFREAKNNSDDPYRRWRNPAE